MFRGITMNKYILALLFVVFVSVVGYSLDKDMPWIPISQISNDTSGNYSIDNTGNGIPDSTDAGIDDILANGATTSRSLVVGSLSTPILTVSGYLVLPASSISSGYVAPEAINSTHIKDKSIKAIDLNDMGCAVGQVLKLGTGGVWQCGNDNAGTSLWSQSGSNIYYNSGNVGIGTTSPSYTLDVNGDARVTGKLRLTDGSDMMTLYTDNTNSYSRILWGDDLNDRLSFYFNYWSGTSNDKEVMSLLPNGNVGIGTTSPSYTLDVYKVGDNVLHLGDYNGNDFSVDIAGGQGLVNLVAGAKVSGNSYVYTGTRGASRIQLHDGSLKLLTSTQTSGTKGSTVSWNTVLYANNAGNVGIGTTSPSAKLDVHGTIISDGGNGDVNNDGSVDVSDAHLVARYVNNLVSLTRSQLAEADVDGNGIVTMEDAEIIGRMSVGYSKESSIHYIHNLAFKGPNQFNVNTILNMTGNRITNVATPVNNNDVATKGYVDAASTPKKEIWARNKVTHAWVKMADYKGTIFNGKGYLDTSNNIWSISSYGFVTKNGVEQTTSNTQTWIKPKFGSEYVRVVNNNNFRDFCRCKGYVTYIGSPTSFYIGNSASVSACYIDSDCSKGSCWASVNAIDQVTCVSGYDMLAVVEV